MTHENLSSGFPIKQISNQLQASKKIEVSLVVSLDMTFKRQITKLLMRLHGCPG